MNPSIDCLNPRTKKEPCFSRYNNSSQADCAAVMCFKRNVLLYCWDLPRATRLAYN